MKHWDTIAIVGVGLIGGSIGPTSSRSVWQAESSESADGKLV
jgi:hypothetical protein